MKRIVALLSAAVLSMSLVACNLGDQNVPLNKGTKYIEDISSLSKEEIMSASNGEIQKQGNMTKDIYLFNPILSEEFDALVEQAKGTEVSFYGWGGDEDLNNWLDSYYAPLMKEKYDITIKRVPMGIEDILSQLTGELQAGERKAKNINDASGTIDMVWINGENFATASENQMLLDYYAWKAPNLEKYMTKDSDKVNFDFGYTIKGREIPYGEAQLVMYNDAELTPETPKNAAEFMEFAKKYKGKVTYPALPDFTGSAFVRNIIYDLVGYEQFQNMDADKSVVKEAIQPAIDYLKELNPYLWNEGKTFPSTSTQMENMFADGELYFGMSYAAYGVAVNIENQKFKPTTRSFIFEKGSVGNTNYLAIPINSPNKAGAIVAINEMISPKVQAERFKTLRTLPVVEYSLLSDEDKKAFDSVQIGQGVLPQDELQAGKLPEMPAKLVPIIEEIWLEEVVGK